MIYPRFIRKEDPMNETHTGLLVNSRVFQETPMMLTGIQLLEDHKIVNCIIKDRFLASYVLRLPLNKYQLEVVVKLNKREQLVIKLMKIKIIDEFIIIVGTPE